jgi:NAD(P)-dependent dehydrogenase (short-subunit alcohol dehydrogenase family)
MTADGVDRHMATNVIGHAVLLSSLLPVLKKTADGGNIARVVLQASNAHEQAPKDTKFASLEELNTHTTDPMQLYGRSKSVLCPDEMALMPKTGWARSSMRASWLATSARSTPTSCATLRIQALSSEWALHIIKPDLLCPQDAHV